MQSKIPKSLLKSKYRKEMWKNSQQILKKLEKVIPVSSIYLFGSFATKKTRPADTDFIILVKTKNQKGKWAVDLPIVPDNEYGQAVLEDAKKWMKQKYGKKFAAVRLK